MCIRDRNKDMLEKFIPWAAHQTEFGGIWDGSGHKMAYWAGAAVDKSETPAPMIFCFQWRSITRQVRAFQGLMAVSYTHLPPSWERRRCFWRRARRRAAMGD